MDAPPAPAGESKSPYASTAPDHVPEPVLEIAIRADMEPESAVAPVDERPEPASSSKPADLETPSTNSKYTDPKKFKNMSSPSHILMALSVPSSAASSMPSSEVQSVRRGGVEINRFDPRIQRDYISKRKRAYDAVSKSANSIRKDAGSAMFGGIIVNVWDGVSKVERQLVQCCERLPDDRGDADTSSNNATDEQSDEDYDGHKQQSLGGVLAVENEVRFAAILACRCHSMASKSLALAILERTLEAHLSETSLQQKMDEQERATVDQEGKIEVEAASNETTSMPHDVENDMNTRSSWFSRAQPPSKRMKTEENSESVEPSLVKDSTSGETERAQRLEMFFAAGGLKILNQWIADASSYEIVPFKYTQSSSAIDKNASSVTASRERKASSTRPIILTILRFLEHIPFDKKVVLSSKINKQIHKLGKRVTTILYQLGEGEAKKEDLENWTTEDAMTESAALAQTREAVDAVKASWLEKTKKSERSGTVLDPFKSTKEKIKERMEILTRFQNGEISQPEWYQPPRMATSADAKKISSAGSAASSGKRKKLNTQELAAQERKAEREKLQRKIEQVQSRSQKNMEELRERLRRRKEENTISVPLVRAMTGKRVAWKDGLHTQTMRHRHKLEEVFVFIKGMPSAPGTGGEIEDVEADQNSSTSTTETH